MLQYLTTYFILIGKHHIKNQLCIEIFTNNIYNSYSAHNMIQSTCKNVLCTENDL